jgi:DNA polymerase-4
MSEIAHIDIDAFFASLEQARCPELRKRPVVVGGDSQGRGVVISASYQARQCGIRKAMPLSQARKLCPDGIFLTGNQEYYQNASRSLLNIAQRYSPLVHQISHDQLNVDLSGSKRLLGHPLVAAERLRKEIKQILNLSASVGLAATRLVAQVACRQAKPKGILRVFPGYEERFLAPLPLNKLPYIKEEEKEKLFSLGIRTIGQLARLKPELLQQSFGPLGLLLQLRAQGQDSGTVPLSIPAVKSISRQQTFPRDTVDLGLLEAALYQLCERTGTQLRRLGMRAKRLNLRICYTDFKQVSRTITLREPTGLALELFQAAERLLHDTFQRRVRLRSFRLTLSQLSHSGWQLNLFQEEKNLRLARLYQQVDRIRQKYGFHSLHFGRLLASEAKEKGRVENFLSVDFAFSSPKGYLNL